MSAPTLLDAARQTAGDRVWRRLLQEPITGDDDRAPDPPPNEAAPADDAGAEEGR